MSPPICLSQAKVQRAAGMLPLQPETRKGCHRPTAALSRSIVIICFHIVASSQTKISNCIRAATGPLPPAEVFIARSVSAIRPIAVASFRGSVLRAALRNCSCAPPYGAFDAETTAARGSLPSRSEPACRRLPPVTRGLPGDRLPLSASASRPSISSSARNLEEQCLGCGGGERPAGAGEHACAQQAPLRAPARTISPPKGGSSAKRSPQPRRLSSPREPTGNEVPGQIRRRIGLRAVNTRVITIIE